MKQVQNQAPTFESVWALLEKSSAEWDKNMKESRAEWDKSLKESRANFERELKESRAEWDKGMKEIRELQAENSKQISGMGNNQGKFAEEYFFNSFNKGKQNFFGEKFDEIENSVKGIEKGFKDEYDILMLNGHSVGIVEVKYKAHENDIPKVLNKANTFRANFPKYKNHKVYLGLATMAFYPKLEEECINQGIAIIKQVGDTVVINDKHLKAF